MPARVQVLRAFLYLIITHARANVKTNIDICLKIIQELFFCRNFFEGFSLFLPTKSKNLQFFHKSGVDNAPRNKAENLSAAVGRAERTKPRPRAGMVSRVKVRGRAAASRNKRRVGAAAEREGERVSAKES